MTSERASTFGQRWWNNSQLGVVDEDRLVVHPVALGAGLPLFSDLPSPLSLELVDSERFATGVLRTVYRPRRPAEVVLEG